MDDSNLTTYICNIESLTPHNGANNNELYIELLDIGISDKRPDTKNIALSGPYGAGKSTILNSFLAFNSDKTSEKKKITNISMASFSEFNESNEPQPVDIKIIEKTILQQMFYSVKKEEIPLSRLTRIVNINKAKIQENTIDILFWLTMIIVVLNFQSFALWVQSFEYGKIVYIIAFLFFSLLSAYLTIKHVSSFFNYLKRLNLQKVAFRNIELTFSDIDSSLLNKNIDEILYFFESTKTNVIVFEDLDRFNNPAIFVNLRELNTQINNSAQVTQKVTFIYAVKEDMFKNEDRVKFFDLIIPVIPFINSANSKEMLMSKLKSLNLEDKIDKQFLFQISIFINDMRLLTNIVNEFLVYYHQIATKEQNNTYNNGLVLEKLFAIIIYKNFHPDDFAKLHKREGNLYDLLHNSKVPMIEDEIQRLDIAIKKEKDALKDANNDLSGLKDLFKLIMIDFMYEYKIVSIEVSDVHYTPIELTEDTNSFNDFLLDLEACQYTTNSYSWRSFNSSHQTKLDNIKQALNYDKRLQDIKNKEYREQKRLKDNILKLSKEKTDLQQTPIGSLISKYSKNVHIPDSVSKNELLYYLITNNYIDEESYSTYISLSHDLSSTDLVFLRNILNSRPNDTVVYIHNIASIIEKLSLKDYSKPSILNLNFVNYILERKHEFPNEYEAILNQLSIDSEEARDLIFCFVADDSKRKDILLNDLGKIRHDLWETLSSEFYDIDITEEDWLAILLLYIDIEDLHKINSLTNGLVTYINQLPDFLDFVYKHNFDFKKITDLILNETTSIGILSIPKNEQTEKLFRFIVENNLYDINDKNLQCIMHVFEDKVIPFEIAISYSYISSEYPQIKSYIDDNINSYYSYAYIQHSHNEDIASILEMVHNPELNKENRETLIQNMDSFIDDIQKVDEIYWALFLQYKKIEPIWENILTIYQAQEEAISPEVLDYLNDSDIYVILQGQSLDNIDGYETGKDKTFLSYFRLSLFKHPDLQANSLKSLAQATEKCWTEPNIQDFKKEKLKVFIESGLLCATPTNYNNLKNHMNNQELLHILLAEQYSKEFIKNILDFALEYSDIILLISSAQFTHEEKVNLYELINITKLQDALPYDFIHYLFSQSLYDTSDCIHLLINQIEYLSKSEVIELINTLDEPYNRLMKQTFLELANTKLHEDFAKALEKKSIIKKFTPVKHKNKFRFYKY